MRFRLGYVLGFGTGYYLGARAGQARYDQLNRLVSKVRRSDAYEAATRKAKDVVDDGVERAKDLVEEHRPGTAETGEPATFNGATTVASEDVLAEDLLAEPVVAEDLLAESVVSEPVPAEPVMGEPVMGEPVVGEDVLPEEPDPAVHDLSPGPPPAGSLSEDPRPGGPAAP
ncbi:MAG: hypothetical protein M3P97_03230 [Actinomycetota bacterium]|jgi:hypothetical protein|nr:hypothetical protein [Actinomycetota bacterium]